MAKTFMRALSSVLMQAVGLFFMGFYLILTVSSGQFFKKPTAEYKSELVLGKLLLSPVQSNTIYVVNVD